VSDRPADRAPASPRAAGESSHGEDTARAGAEAFDVERFGKAVEAGAADGAEAGEDEEFSEAYGDEAAEAWFEADDQFDAAAWREWDVKVQAAKAEAERTGRPVRLPAAPGGDSGLIMLNVDSPLIEGRVEPPEPAGLSPKQKQRRALADRLAEVLVNNPPGDERAEYAVASLSLPAKVRYARVIRAALTEASEVAERSEPGAVKVRANVGGVVIRLHGPAWSMVFRLSPYQVPVLFVTDGMPDRARRVDGDPDWQPEINAAVAAVVRELSRYSLGGDKYVYGPWSGAPDDG
jgi:hypothetical protein